MRTRTLLAVGVLVLLPAVAGAWGHEPERPDGTVMVTELGNFELWPYTGTDYSGNPSDPVNLFFLDADPRAIRQAH